MTGRPNKRKVNKLLLVVILIVILGAAAVMFQRQSLVAGDHEVDWVLDYKSSTQPLRVCGYQASLWPLPIPLPWRTNCKVNLKLMNFPASGTVTITASHMGMDASNDHLFNEFKNGTLSVTVNGNGSYERQLHVDRDALPALGGPGKWKYDVTPPLIGTGPRGNPEIIIEN